MIATFNKKNPFNLSRWMEAKRYQDTFFGKWMSSQLGVLLIANTAPRWDAGNLTDDEIGIVMSALTQMIPRKAFVGFYNLDKSWDSRKLMNHTFMELLKTFTDQEELNDVDWKTYRENLSPPDNSDKYKQNSIPTGNQRNKYKSQNQAFPYQRTDLQVAQISRGRSSPPGRQNNQYRNQSDRGGKSFGFKNPNWSNQRASHRQDNQRGYGQTRPPYQPRGQASRPYQNDRYRSKPQETNQPRKEVSRDSNHDNYNRNENNRGRPGFKGRGNYGKGNQNKFSRRVNAMEENENLDDYLESDEENYGQNTQYQGQASGKSNIKDQARQYPKKEQAAPAGSKLLNVGAMKIYGSNDH